MLHEMSTNVNSRWVYILSMSTLTFSKSFLGNFQVCLQGIRSSGKINFPRYLISKNATKLPCLLGRFVLAHFCVKNKNLPHNLRCKIKYLLNKYLLTFTIQGWRKVQNSGWASETDNSEIWTAIGGLLLFNSKNLGGRGPLAPRVPPPLR